MLLWYCMSMASPDVTYILCWSYLNVSLSARPDDADDITDDDKEIEVTELDSPSTHPQSPPLLSPSEAPPPLSDSAPEAPPAGFHLPSQSDMALQHPPEQTRGRSSH